MTLIVFLAGVVILLEGAYFLAGPIGFVCAMLASLWAGIVGPWLVDQEHR